MKTATIAFLLFLANFLQIGAHEGKSLNLLEDFLKSTAIHRDSIGTAEKTTSLADYQEFENLLFNSGAQPTVVMISKGIPGEEIVRCCHHNKVAFTYLDPSKNPWIDKWLLQKLSFTPVEYPLFLFLRGSKLLLPLGEGVFSKETFEKILLKKFALSCVEKNGDLLGIEYQPTFLQISSLRNLKNQ
jgi:hypothetical protein